MASIGRMGFFSQIHAISFPQKCDILAIQCAENRNSQSFGDSLVRATNGVDALNMSTFSMTGYTNGFAISKAILNAIPSQTSSAVTGQAALGVYKGPAPTFNFGTGGGFTGSIINTDLVYTLGGAAQVGYNWNGGTPKYNYAARAYCFVNMTLYRKLFNATLLMGVTFGGSTFSNYALWAEYLPNQRGIGFGNNLVGFGGVNLQNARSMGWAWQNMTHWAKGIGTPSGSGSLANLTPKISLSMSPAGGPISLSGSGFAANNVFSQTAGNNSND